MKGKRGTVEIGSRTSVFEGGEQIEDTCACVLETSRSISLHQPITRVTLTPPGPCRFYLGYGCSRRWFCCIIRSCLMLRMPILPQSRMTSAASGSQTRVLPVVYVAFSFKP